MARIALGLEYDGTDFVGWQTQRSGRNVQDALVKAASAVANQAVLIFGAGRTDSGVHAAYQVAHFDTSAVRTTRDGFRDRKRVPCFCRALQGWCNQCTLVACKCSDRSCGRHFVTLCAFNVACFTIF